MPTVELTIELPPRSWIGEVSNSFAGIKFRVLTILVDDGMGHAVLEVETGEPGKILKRLQLRPEISTVDLLSVDADRGVFQIETENTRILEPFLAAGVPLKTPLCISEGVASWEFTTSHNRLSDLSTHLEASGLTYHVDRIGQDNTDVTSDGSVLTDRQTEVFEIARSVGYFEIPRSGTLLEIANQAGVSKSTANETLRRAIRNIVTTYGPSTS